MEEATTAWNSKDYDACFQMMQKLAQSQEDKGEVNIYGDKPREWMAVASKMEMRGVFYAL